MPTTLPSRFRNGVWTNLALAIGVLVGVLVACEMGTLRKPESSSNNNDLSSNNNDLAAVLNPVADSYVRGDTRDAGTVVPNWPTSRDPRKWPFARTSIWNMPLHKNAKYVPAGIDKLGSFYAGGDVIVLTPNAPMTDVLWSDGGWSAGKDRCVATTKLVDRIPIPVDVMIKNTGDGCLAALMPDGRTIHQNQPFERCTAGAPATSQWYYGKDDIITGDGRPGAHGGSGMSSMGGALRGGELVRGGVIRHALKLAIHGRYLSNFNGSYRWPAFKGENDYSSKNNEMRMGVLLALLPSFDISSLKTEPGRIIVKAFQDYGAYVADCSSKSYNPWMGNEIYVEMGPHGSPKKDLTDNWGYQFSAWEGDKSYASPWREDMQAIFLSLHAIANNDKDNIGGGPTSDESNRRAPMAPPFAP